MVDRSMDRPDISASQQRHRLRHATLPTIFHPKYRGNCCDAHSPVVIICPNIGTAEEGLNNQVVPFKSPADPPQCPNAAEIHGFVPRYQKFKSISLQRGVSQTPGPARS